MEGNVCRRTYLPRGPPLVTPPRGSSRRNDWGCASSRRIRTQIDLTHQNSEQQLGHITGPRTSTDEPVMVTISNAQRLSLAIFRCEVYSSNTFYSGLPSNYRKLRFVAPAFEWTMDQPPNEMPKGLPVSLRGSIKFPPLSDLDRVVSLAELMKVSRVLRHLLDAPRSGLRIELRCGTASWTLPETISQTIPSDAEILADLLEKTFAITNDFGLDLDIPVTTSAIVNQQEHVHFMWKALQRPRGLATQIPFSSGDRDLTGLKGAIVVPTSIVLGEQRLLAVFAISGPVRRLSPTEGEGMGVEIFDSEFQILWKEVAPAAGWSSQALAKRVQEVAKQIDGDGFAFVLPPSAQALAQSMGEAGS